MFFAWGGIVSTQDVSVIITVKNEEMTVIPLLESLVSQTRQPDEVIIVDGGSTDRTISNIKTFAQKCSVPIRLIIRPGYNISQGRNEAIKAAKGPIIASTDAGVKLSPDWLAALTAPFERDSQIPVVSGWFIPAPQTEFETAMGATVLPELSEIDPEKFIPSSRSVAFRKEAWRKVGGYPEWLDYCEDIIFDLRLRDLYGSFPFATDAVAYFRPRSTLLSFWRQYFRYARGDGKADLWRAHHIVRYLAYLIAVLLLVMSLLHSPWLLGLLLAGATLYLWAPYRRLRSILKASPKAHLGAIFLIPIIRLIGDSAKMVGYPIGLIWRYRHRTQNEIYWRKHLRSKLGSTSPGPSRWFF